MNNLYNKTAHELSDMLAKKEISSSELTESVIKRIETGESDISAYNTFLFDDARKKAFEVDKKIAAGEALSPLAGIPLAVKDNICMDGVLTTCSSKMLENFVPPYDATVISRLKASDSVFIGRTSMDEFAMGNSNQTSYLKKASNPINTDYVPGGSSGGSAAAVASGEAILALGSDTGGSIRQPSAFCGVVGLKPTYGTVPRFGLIAFGSSLDQIGPITKDVTDSAMLYRAIAGYDAQETTSLDVKYPDFTSVLNDGVKGLRVGIPKEYFETGVDEESKAAVLSAAKKLEEMGAVVSECSLPYTKYGVSVYHVISMAEASSNLGKFDCVKFGYRDPDAKDLEELYINSRTKGFGDEVKRRVMLGTWVVTDGKFDEYYKQAAKVRTLIMQSYDNAFESFDLLLAPTTKTSAWKKDKVFDSLVESYSTDACAVSANIVGIPAISVPFATGQNGLPIGVQLMANRLCEQTIFKAAFALENCERNDPK